MANARSGGSPGTTQASSTRASSTSRDLPPNQRCEAFVPSRTSPSRKCRSPCRMRSLRSAVIGRVLKLEPEEAARAEREQVGQLPDPGELGVAEELDRHTPGEGGEVELDGLRGTGEIVDAEDDVLRERAAVGEDLRVLRPQDAIVADPEHRMLLAQLDESPQPAEE